MSDRKRERDELRKEATRIEQEIVARLDERAEVAKKLALINAEEPGTKGPGDIAELERLAETSSGSMPRESLVQVLRAMHANVTAIEQPVGVIYVGPEGGSGHAAVRERFGALCRAISVDNLQAAFDGVTRQGELAVVPYETREDGSVQATMLALSRSEARIVSCFEITHHVDLVNKTGNIADIERIYAIGAQHAQCADFLGAHLAKVPVLDVKSPMLAIRFAAEDHGAATFADRAFEGELGLQVVRRDIRDEGEERIRYAVIGTRPLARTGRDRSVIAISVPDSPGALHEVLKQFAEREINLSKIQSRPVPGDSWKYIFFIEIEGHPTDRNMVQALDDVKRLTKFFRVLGSYEVTF